MSEIILSYAVVYSLGVITLPCLKHRKEIWKLLRRTEEEFEESNSKRRGRPRGSKNKPKEKKE